MTNWSKRDVTAFYHRYPQLACAGGGEESAQEALDATGHRHEYRDAMFGVVVPTMKVCVCGDMR